MSISEFSHAPSHARGSATPTLSRRQQNEPWIALIRDDVYAVLDERETMGFVERVGNVYVAMFGGRQLKSIEVGQSLSWDVAVEMVCLAHRRQKSSSN